MNNNTDPKDIVKQKFGFELREDNAVYNNADVNIITGQSREVGLSNFDWVAITVAKDMRVCCLAKGGNVGEGDDDVIGSQHQDDCACICPHCGIPDALLTKHRSENGFSKLKCQKCGFEISCGDVSLDLTFTPDLNPGEITEEVREVTNKLRRKI
jgi:hypothetical protein